MKKTRALRIITFILVAVFLVGCNGTSPNDLDENNPNVYTPDSNNNSVMYTVYFDTDSDYNLNPLTVESGRTISLPTPEKNGYVFLGWFTGKTVNDGQFTSTSSVHSNMTLYARWEPRSYKIIFNSNGGSSINTMPFLFGDTVSELPKSQKQGYVQVGWYLDSNLTTLFDFQTYPAHDLTLYAKWIDSFTMFSNYMRDNGTRSEPPFYNQVIHDDSYFIKLGCDYSDRNNRERECLGLQINLFDDGTIAIFGRYVFSDNSSMRVGIFFDYGSMKSPRKVDYVVYEINDSKIVSNGFDLSAKYYSNGWSISLYPSSIGGGLPGSISNHNENAELLADLIVLSLEEYFIDLGLPMFE